MSFFKRFFITHDLMAAREKVRHWQDQWRMTAERLVLCERALNAANAQIAALQNAPKTADVSKKALLEIRGMATLGLSCDPSQAQALLRDIRAKTKGVDHGTAQR